MKNILSFFLLFISVTGLAQSQCRITGTIMDQSTGEPVPFAYAILEKNNNFITGVISSDDGSFQLLTTENDSITLIVQYVGYETIARPLYISGDRTFNL